MLKRLQQKWNVSSLQLLLILCTFAIGGSLTGYTGRKILNLFDLNQDWLWVLIYVVLITMLWPLSVILVSIPMGQFRFFNRYIHKLGSRIGIAKKPEKLSKTGQKPIKLAIFASGKGSNAQKIIYHFRWNPAIKVVLVVSNKSDAGVLDIAANAGIPSLIIEKDRFFKNDGFLPYLAQNEVDFVILAGFLWKIPEKLISAYPGKILNIHPALLPKFGGKGMYGHHVHEAVLAAGETESGITIHLVDEQYDHGKTIAQFKCPVLAGDTADSLAERIHGLEHAHFPEEIEKFVAGGR